MIKGTKQLFLSSLLGFWKLLAALKWK